VNGRFRIQDLVSRVEAANSEAGGKPYLIDETTAIVRFIFPCGKVEGLIAKWRSEGLKTRRNWWEIFAGDSKGNQRTVDGIKFPVVRARHLPALPASPLERRTRPSRSNNRHVSASVTP